MTPSPALRVVILGGSGAIGAACAHRFAEHGARILLGYRQDESAAAAVLSALPSGIHEIFQVDIANTQSIESCVKRAESALGGADVLVNAAGYTRPIPHTDLAALDDEFFDDMLRVNLRGAYAAVRAFAPLLKRSDAGLAVTISSIAAETGIGSNIAYCAAKAGVDVMTKSLARVLAPEVRVMAVSPGVVDTDFVPGRDAQSKEKIARATPLQRIATAYDVADAVLACATHLRFSTGSIVRVDGGRAL